MDADRMERKNVREIVRRARSRAVFYATALPTAVWAPTIGQQLPTGLGRTLPAGVVSGRRRIAALLVGLLTTSGLCGCSLRNNRHADPQGPPCVVAVAPVLNLSNSVDWDPLRVTDILASELQTFPGVVVVPVNRTLAALELQERRGVQTAQDALDLGAALNADAVVVAALTEYVPYDPPRVGLVVQWYSLRRSQLGRSDLDPVLASRRATDLTPVADVGPLQQQPTWQAQAVYSGSAEDVLEDIRRYDEVRGGHNSPFGWKVHIKSQEAFVRYCCWATLRSMLLARAHALSASAEPDEVTR